MMTAEIDQIVKRVGCLLILWLLLIPGAEPALAESKARTVRVGYFAFPGYHMIDKHGVRSGYGYEYLQNIARYTNWVYDYQGYGTSWSENLSMLENGEIDLLTSARKTPEREKRFGFSEESIGISYTVVTVREGNARFAAGDYSALDGARVGMLMGSTRNEGFRAFAENNGFCYQPVLYETEAALTQALQSGYAVDAIVASSLRAPRGEAVVARFDPEPFYAIVRKGDEALLGELNDAIAQIKIDNPGLSETLLKRYYTANTAMLPLTREEETYLADLAAQGKTLKALMRSGRYPLTDVRGGQPVGILVELAQAMFERAGLSVEIVAAPTEQAYAYRMKSESIDFELDAAMSLNEAEQSGYKLTDPYYASYLSAILRKDCTAQQSVAAVEDAAITNNYIRRHYLYRDTYLYASIDDCVAAVARGARDMTILENVIATDRLRQDERNQLYALPVAGSETSVTFAVRVDRDPSLLTILQKAVSGLSADDVNAITARYALPTNQPFSLIGYLYDNPVAGILITLALSLLVGLLILAQLRERRRRFERQRAAEYARFIAYVCKANDSVLELDRQNKKLTEYVVTGETVCRRTSDALFLDELSRMVYGDDLETAMAMFSAASIDRLVASGEEGYEELRMRVTSGEYRWFAYTLQPVARDAAHPLNVMIFKKDIDAAKRAEKDHMRHMTEALHLAQTASAAQNRLMMHVSHQIKTPLNAILGYVALAQNSRKPSNVPAYLEKAEAAGQRMLSLVNDLLDMAALENGELQLAQRAFDLRELLAALQKTFEPQVQAKGLKLTVVWQPDMATQLVGDAERLSQILSNLLSNAVLYTESGGVCLSAAQSRATGGQVFLNFTVADTGVGMDKAFLAHIFDPFLQKDEERRNGNLGLGLAITKNLVDMMQGVLTVASEKGRGTTFRVDLSFALQAGAAAPQTLPMDDAVLFDGESVLVVEDNDINFEILRRLLRKVKLQVLRADNGQMAVDAFSRAEPFALSAVLMDILMPVMDGYEATRAIRALDRPDAAVVPILALSANALPEDVARSMAAGMNAHLGKPIVPRQLYALLEEFLHRS